jgi:hypothetical protein
MKEKEIFSKNLILSTEFDRYILEHPDFAEKIPQNAQIVLLPEDDPELCRQNIAIAKAQREPEQRVVYVHIEKIIPQVSRLVNPRLELGAA